ncbi:hypothetical protein BDV19DRAFT_366093 [Aspergillus venezuelensis]
MDIAQLRTFSSGALLFIALSGLLAGLAGWNYDIGVAYVNEYIPTPPFGRPCKTWSGTRDGYKFEYWYSVHDKECIRAGHRYIAKQAVGELLSSIHDQSQRSEEGGEGEGTVPSRTTKCIALDKGGDREGFLRIGPEEDFDKEMYCGPIWEPDNTPTTPPGIHFMKQVKEMEEVRKREGSVW